MGNETTLMTEKVEGRTLVLGISGSPRRGGNSETLLDEALLGAHEAGAQTEKVILSALKFSPCISCGACLKSGVCVQKDEMQGLYAKILATDVLIFASPIYFYSVSAWTKSAIDRCQALWARKYVLKDQYFKTQKKGYFIAVGASKGNQLFEGAKLVMKYFFDATGYTLAGKLLVDGVDGKEEILKYPEYLKDAHRLGAEAIGL
ncbi:flavodoxin family protein [Desulfosporosinus sp. SB140]|uniref:flavodoxin family protein n=1 Tax=Desulfosporosinus paludis TaxID=3115649 RepID=UPI003890BFD2